MAAGSLGLHGLDLEAYCLVYTTTDIKKICDVGNEQWLKKQMPACCCCNRSVKYARSLETKPLDRSYTTYY